MKYRKDKYGKNISALGMGCMRFERNGGSIDIDRAASVVEEALAQGINYFDTAYTYPGSEAALGEALSRLSARDKVYIATKLPHYMIRSRAGAEKRFAEELARLQTDHVDFYLMHMLNDVEKWNKLCELGIDDWLSEQKALGRIGEVGFSYHGDTAGFCALLDCYDWDFCQIQYNYVDEDTQAGRRGLQYAAEKNIPVVIMEPLRGGRLVEMLPRRAKEIISSSEQKLSAAQLGLKWLFDQPEIMCVLSGMSTPEMVRENAQAADTFGVGCMDEADFALLEQVKAEIAKSVKVKCSGCGYCMPCPHGVDIPAAFSCYNAVYTENAATARMEYIKCTLARRTPSSASLCRECGKCEAHCPQGIAIRTELKAVRAKLETPIYKLSRFGVRLLRLWG